MNKAKRVSPSLEDYLENILFLHEKNSAVRVTDLAAQMNISKPSVNKAINILKTQGFVDHEHYGLLSLTDEGKRIAELVALRHFTIKSFLVGVLGIEPELAEEEACKLEHSMTMETVFKLRDFMEEYSLQKQLQEKS